MATMGSYAGFIQTQAEQHRRNQHAAGKYGVDEPVSIPGNITNNINNGNSTQGRLPNRRTMASLTACSRPVAIMNA